jgi:hypothetical protein
MEVFGQEGEGELRKFLELPGGIPDESTDIGWVEGKEGRRDLKRIIEYRCWRTVKGETSETERYYISNADMRRNSIRRSEGIGR